MTLVTVKLVVWALYAGLVIGAAGAVWSKRVPGRLVRALHKKEAFSPEAALTLAEAGLKPDFLLRSALRHGATLRRYVTAVNEDEALLRTGAPGRGERAVRRVFSAERRPRYAYDFKTQRWYLDPERQFVAAVRYDGRGCNVPMVILTAVLLLGLAFALLWVLPYLGDFFNSVLDSFAAVGK